jgi:hypothetical protein
MDCEILAARERSKAKKNPNMNHMGENFHNKRIAATTKKKKKNTIIEPTRIQKAKLEI